MIMRWLFLFMLVVNFSYISWEMTKANKASSTVESVQSSKNVPSIVLLSERKTTGSIAQQKKIQSDHVGGSKPVSASVSIPAKEKTVLSSVVKQQKPVFPPAHKSSEKSVKSVPVASSPPGTDTRTEGKKIQPASNGPVSVSGASMQKNISLQKNTGSQQIEPVKVNVATNSDTPEKPQPKVDVCYSLGPFHNLKTVHKVMRDIKQYVSAVSYREHKEKDLSLFWVYIKPASSRKEVEKKARRLKKRKIRDYYIIREGDKNNGISLGYFKNRNSAYKLSKKVKKAGFDVTVESLSRSNTSYRLDYRLLATRTIPEAIEKQYLSGKNRRSAQTCTRMP